MESGGYKGISKNDMKHCFFIEIELVYYENTLNKERINFNEKKHN